MCRSFFESNLSKTDNYRVTSFGGYLGRCSPGVYTRTTLLLEDSISKPLSYFSPVVRTCAGNSNLALEGKFMDCGMKKISPTSIWQTRSATKAQRNFAPNIVYSLWDAMDRVENQHSLPGINFNQTDILTVHIVHWGRCQDRWSWCSQSVVGLLDRTPRRLATQESGPWSLLDLWLCRDTQKDELKVSYCCRIKPLLGGHKARSG